MENSQTQNRQAGDIPLPPFHLRPTFDDSRYLSSGWTSLNLIRKWVPIAPSFRIVDIGCAAGRLAMPLLDVIADDGAYVGVDIVKSRIEWAQQHISIKFPNFQFSTVDIQSKYMNRDGTVSPSEAHLPVANEWADLVILLSVFTHMTGPGIRRYFAEAERILKPGGHLFSTYFIYDEEAEKSSRAAISGWDFSTDLGDVRVVQADQPEYAVAVKEEVLSGLGTVHGFQVAGESRGAWRRGVKNAQDVVVHRKSSS